jgi:large subunit ribosomal protein L17
MAYRKLGTRTSEHRRALLANLTKEVIMHERIETTEERAKEVRRFIEKAITYGKKGTVEARRDAVASLMNDKIVAKKLFEDLAKRYADRNGGYTRIIKLKERRGDDALMVILELV